MPNGNGNVKKIPTKGKIHLTIPLKALSTNKLYAGVKKRSWHYKKFRKEMFRFLGNIEKVGVCLSGNLVMDMEVGFSSPLNDLSNSIKGTEDILAEWLGFNDRQIVTMVLNKFLVKKGDEYIKVTLRKTKKNVDRRRKN